MKTSLVGTLSELVYNRGELVCIENFQIETREDYTSLIDHDLYSYLGVPLESKGKILRNAMPVREKSSPITIGKSGTGEIHWSTGRRRRR